MPLSPATQGELDLALPVEMKKESKNANKQEARGSILSMIELALELGYANNVGELLDQVAAVRKHRLFNSLLAVLQRPHAKLLLPKTTWENEWGRTILPNEQPLVLLLNWGPVQFLFDVSQTEPTERARVLPASLANPFSMDHAQDADFALHWAEENAKHDGVRISPSRYGFDHAGCIWRSKTDAHVVAEWSDGRRPAQKIRVRYEMLLNSSFSSTEKLATLAHELGHLYCGHQGATKADWWPTRDSLEVKQREFEAESVARLVFRRIAPGTELPEYLDAYFIRDEPMPTDGWDVVVAAADRVVDMCQGFSPTKSK